MNNINTEKTGYVNRRKSSIKFDPHQEFAQPASDEQIERMVAALEANGIQALVAEKGEEAKRIFLELIPEESEVFLGASITLETLGIMRSIHQGDTMHCTPGCSPWTMPHRAGRSASWAVRPITERAASML